MPGGLTNERRKKWINSAKPCDEWVGVDDSRSAQASSCEWHDGKDEAAADAGDARSTSSFVRWSRRRVVYSCGRPVSCLLTDLRHVCVSQSSGRAFVVQTVRSRQASPPSPPSSRRKWNLISRSANCVAALVWWARRQRIYNAVIGISVGEASVFSDDLRRVKIWRRRSTNLSAIFD